MAFRTMSTSKHILKNVLAAVPGAQLVRRRWRPSPFGPGDTTADWCGRRARQVAELIAAYRRVWSDDWLNGRSVLELGSGVDSIVPYAFCALGAASGLATDMDGKPRFGLPDDLVSAVRATIGPSVSDDLVRLRLKGAGGVIAERVADLGKFDLIVSTSTLEHVRKPAKAIDSMRRALNPGGRMVHAIAMANHCCDDHERNRLGHLVYSEWLWAAMFSQRVGHNRLRWFEWERLYADAGLKIVDVQLARIPPAEVAAWRSRLAPRFKRMTPEQLEPSYATVCCEV